MPYPAYQVCPTELTRITKNASIPGVGENRIHLLKHVIFPPEEAVTKYGRCNMPNQNYVSGLTDEEREYMDIIMEFLVNCFAKEADTENDLDYYLSAYLSNKILSQPSARYDGILYPSVQDRLGTSNLALTQNGFLNNFEPTEVTHDVLISIKNGGAMFQGIHRSCKFDLTGGIKEGTIIWND